jgi:Domain of unknown function (DUF4424)
MTRYCAALLAAGATASFAASPSRANDSSVELSVGGLVFAKHAEVAVSSEDLTIAPDTVTVRHVFLNYGPAPVTIGVKAATCPALRSRRRSLY